MLGLGLGFWSSLIGSGSGDVVFPDVSFWSLGYKAPYEDTPVSAIDFGALTHVVQVGQHVYGDGTLNDFSLHTDDLIPAAHAAGVRVLMNITDENSHISGLGSTDFNGAVTNNQATLITNVITAMETMGADGVDVDWETNRDMAKLLTFLTALRAALDPDKQLTVAMTITDYSNENVEAIAEQVDRVTVMTYQMSGTFDPHTWFHSALDHDTPTILWSMDLARSRFLAAGVPAAKLNLGIPFFWIRWEDNDAPREAYGASPVKTEVSYTDILSTYPVAFAAVTQDSVARQYWAADSATSWIHGDNADSIAEKAARIQSEGLGGWSIWAIDKDYIAAGSTLAEKHPLLDVIKTALV